MFGAVGVVTYSASVVRNKSTRGGGYGVRGNYRIVGFAKGAGVDEGEVAYIEKALDLAACGRFQPDAVRKDLQVGGVVPLRKLRKSDIAVVDEPRPDQAVAFANGVCLEAQAR